MTAPILRWAGSKKRLLPLLESATPEKFSRYIEPFVGSGVLFLKLNRSRAILGDINKDLIETYETVRDHYRAVWNRLDAMPESEDFYYELRAQSPHTLKAFDRAARFIYLNRYCFNGVYRTNRQGHFNVSRGKGHLYIPEYSVFKEFSARISNADLTCADFEVVVDRAGRGDFVYLDPPYAESGKRDRGEYGLGSFKEEDLYRLAGALLRADRRGAKILLSYTTSKVLRRELDGWKFFNVTVQRNVAGFASDRRVAEELLISNYEWYF